jgi:hypothetical protein|tara:strand:- start:73 stop:246 length:174 start_codon:yes stop_codon:yes gene_type:complete
MEFEFDKFVKDLDKRKLENHERRQIAQHIIEEDERRRLRNIRYNERWQNRIVWEQNQ